MKPKQYRDRAFRGGRPTIAPLDPVTDEGYGANMGYLWAAYKKGSFELPEGLSQEDFAEKIMKVIGSYDMAWIVLDKNPSYAEIGPIGVIVAKYNGWELCPHFDPFAWATPRNILRANVAFFQMMRYQREVGVVVMYCLKRFEKFFKSLKKYGVLNYVGKVPNGTKRGDKYIFYINGRGK